MAERTSHAPGTISWTDLETTDQDGAKAFYGALFGWEYEDMPVGEGATYSMAKLNGRSAAAMSGQRAEDAARGVPPHWNLYVTVADVDAAASAVAGAGGQVFAEPFDVFDAGRMAVIADPNGAALCLWQPGTNIGAEVVNEPGALTWADTATTDAPAAQAFYSAAAGLALRVDERGAAVLGDLQRGPQPGRHDRRAAGCAAELVPVLRRWRTSRRRCEAAEEAGGQAVHGPDRRAQRPLRADPGPAGRAVRDLRRASSTTEVRRSLTAQLPWG